MGSMLSSPQRLVTDVSNFVRRKRKLECESMQNIDEIIDIALHTPKRKKLESTAQYIYQALFKEGKNSDITVEALDHCFYLHKVYLCQSPYFASMFGGSWLETTKSFISIDIVDPFITIQSLSTVFGSLYNTEVTLNPTVIVSILATATMFQLDCIIEKCREVMLETINPKTSVDYYNAACQYGDTKLEEACIQWFLVNLMTYYYNSDLFRIRAISIPLMKKLIAHSNLIVLKTEINVYIMLIQWMYLLINIDTPENITIQDIRDFFISRKEKMPFLLTDEGEKFVNVFQGLRLHNLISHHQDVQSLLQDNVIPKSWIYSIILQQWITTLKINQNEEKGPIDCSKDNFLLYSLRCGRMLEEREKHVWRWTGFHYGIDLIMTADDKSVSVKRSHRPDYEQLLSLQAVRHLTIRVRVVTLNEQRQVAQRQTSGVRQLTLSKNEEATLISFDKDMKFPIIVSANVLYTTPNTTKQNSLEFVHTIA